VIFTGKPGTIWGHLQYDLSIALFGSSVVAIIFHVCHFLEHFPLSHEEPMPYLHAVVVGCLITHQSALGFDKLFFFLQKDPN